ncbi:hypothetical protein [Streptomyces sp. NBC_01233]|uniref:hypothetical protein n=1 Tax=Streptomyces sp. NBC_01233 TaxID=2903787 RepID=UPI002E121C37|nr:hypothetical protein OG332_24685 [Streptomyces sp. NBC_01233]
MGRQRPATCRARWGGSACARRPVPLQRKAEQEEQARKAAKKAKRMKKGKAKKAAEKG